MTLVDRYVLSTFVRVFLWSVLAFLAVFILMDLIDHIDDFVDDEATMLEIGRYYFFRLPYLIDFVTPISMLMASMFTVGILSKNREYAAMLAAGVSLLRLSRTLLVLGVLVTIAAIGWREYVVAAANHRHYDVRDYEIEEKERHNLKGRSDFTHVDAWGRVYVVHRFRTRPPTLDRLSVQTFTDSTLVERIDARRAIWQEDHWELRDGSIRRFAPDGSESIERFTSRRLEGPVEKPSDLSRRRIKHEEMNWRQLRDFANWVDRTGGDSTQYRAEMAHKISFPVINLLVVILGLAIGAARRRTNLWAGFGLTVALAFGYYLMMDFGLELGRGGKVPIWASAWTGNIVYAVAGAWLFVRANR